MSFPPASLTPPTLYSYPQAYFQGIYLGGNSFTNVASAFQLRGDPGSMGIEGLDMATVRTGDTDAPRVHGSYIGLDVLGGRDITVTLDITGAGSNLATQMANLRYALTPTGTTENPFYFQLSPNSPVLCSMVRPRKRTTLVDIPYVLGGLAQNVPVQFHATDPTVWAAQTLSPTVGVPAPLGGFTFPMSFPLSFGGGSNFGLITALNSGDLPCYPIVVFTGPMTYPTLTNASISGNPFIQFAMSLNTGDTLTVNMDPKYRSAVYVTSGSTVGSSRLYTLVQGSNWFPLPPAAGAFTPSSSQLQFSSLDVVPVSGTCEVQYSSAFSAAY